MNTMILKHGASLLNSVGEYSFNMWDSLRNWLQSFFYEQEMELCILGLQSAGKTSLLNAITTGRYEENMISTVGFEIRKIKKGNVNIQMWDLGGQENLRTMWERYCRGVSAILYVVDVADEEFILITRRELHNLLEKPSLAGIPLLLLGNKCDLPNALSEERVIELMRLNSIRGREVGCYMISCKEKVNIDIVIKWLIKHSHPVGVPQYTPIG